MIKMIRMMRLTSKMMGSIDFEYCSESCVYFSYTIIIAPMIGKLKRKPATTHEMKLRIGLTIVSCFSL